MGLNWTPPTHHTMKAMTRRRLARRPRPSDADRLVRAQPRGLLPPRSRSATAQGAAPSNLRGCKDRRSAPCLYYISYLRILLGRQAVQKIWNIGIAYINTMIRIIFKTLKSNNRRISDRLAGTYEYLRMLPEYAISIYF